MQYFRQIINGLSVSFAHGILHRDLKTANILISDGVAKLADFGFCDFIHEQKGKHLKYNVGSPLYMSPEAYRKSIYSYKSEIWGAGIILYEMLLGEQPFKGIDYDALIRSISSGAIYATINASGFVKMLLSRMLSIDLQRRIEIGELTALLNQHTQASKIPPAIGAGQQPAPPTIHSIPIGFTSNTLMKKSAFSCTGPPQSENFGRQYSLTNLTSTPTASKTNSSFLNDTSLSSSLERLPLQQLSTEHIVNRSSSSSSHSINKNPPTGSFGCEQVALADSKPSSSNANPSAPNFEKKKTQIVLASFPEPFKKTFQSKVCIGSEAPCLVSFESHLTSYSARHPEFSSASERLLPVKFVYRMCKLLNESPIASDSRCKRLFLLALQHLESLLNYFESENYYFIAECSEQSSYKKILARTQAFRKEFGRNHFSEDEYFVHMASDSTNFNEEAAVRYVQFWTRRVLRHLSEIIQSQTSNLTKGFDTYEVQQQFSCYQYALKYYEVLESMRGRASNEDLPAEVGLNALLAQQLSASSECFIGMAQQAKSLVK